MGLGLDYIKLGGLHGAERMTKYNRLISLEEELAQRGILGGFFFLSLPSFSSCPEKERADKARGREAGRWALESTHLSLRAAFERRLCKKSYKCVFACEHIRMKTPYLESVNWLPNYTQGQMLLHPWFL